MIVNDKTINKGTNNIVSSDQRSLYGNNKKPNFYIKIQNDRDKMLNDLDD